MPLTDPASLDLYALFRDADMFESRRSWSAAGFRVIERSNNGKIMVAGHPSIHGLLFKKYTSDVSQKDQTRNYKRRVEGSKQLRTFIDKHRLSGVTTPRKWILELPRAFSRKETSNVLVVEKLDLVSDEQTKAAYYRIDPLVLKDLCAALFHFRGMDSNAKNIPFVSDGRIAFIDTEHWDRSTSKSYLHHVGEYLSSGHRNLAKSIFDQLEDGEDVSRVAVGGDFVDEEDTSDSSDSSDDFAAEKDTSASSS